MADTWLDIINASMGRSQNPNYDDIQASMGGAQATGGTPTPSTGYDIILARSDSIGNGVYDGNGSDTDVANVSQWRTRAPAGISADITPLDSGTAQASQPTANPYSPINSFAKAYTARTSRKVLVMLDGYNGSGYNDGGWSVGGVFHEDFITKANAAIAAAKAVDATSAVVAIVEILGTNDGGMAKATFKTAASAASSDVRSRVTGAAAVPFVRFSQMPENIATLTSRRDIWEAIQEIALADANGRYVGIREGFNFVGDTASQGDFTHPSNPGGRQMGADADTVLADMTAPIISTASTAAVADGSPIALVLAANEYVTWSISGADAGLFEIVRTYGTGGVGSINTTRAVNTLRLTANANTNYATKPSYAVSVQARDASGNVASKAITVTVSAPYGVGDQGPVSVAWVGNYAKSTDGSIQSGDVSFPITACPAGQLILSFTSSGGSADVTAVKIGGTNGAVIATAGNANGGPTTLRVVNAAAGDITVIATLSGGNGLAVDLTMEAAVVNGTKAAPIAFERIAKAFRNPPFTTASITCPTNGFIIGIGSATLTTTPVTGCTAISGPPLPLFVLSRTTTGAVGYNLSDASTSWLTAIAFEKSV